MEKSEFLLDPKWISSFYAIVATAVCTLFFTYKGLDFFDAFVKTFFTAISFYLFGVATAAAVNFYYLEFIKPKEEEQQEEEEEGEETEEEEGESLQADEGENQQDTNTEEANA